MTNGKYALRNEGEVRLSGLYDGADAYVRFPFSSEHRHAKVLGTLFPDAEEGAPTTVVIYLDRLIHSPGEESVGEYSVSGGVTTILTGPVPAHLRAESEERPHDGKNPQSQETV